MSAMLGRASYDVAEASCGAEAIALAGSLDRLDLAILDFQVPDDGLRMYCRLLEVAPKLAGRILVHTRRAPSPDQQEFLRLFPGRVLLRPVSERHLCEAVKEALACARRQRSPRRMPRRFCVVGFRALERCGTADDARPPPRFVRHTDVLDERASHERFFHRPESA
jgi:CheY-like chemotaxis protein